jgi:hypothetical protein
MENRILSEPGCLFMVKNEVLRVMKQRLDLFFQGHSLEFQSQISIFMLFYIYTNPWALHWAVRFGN